MASPSQITANQQNAQSSTGPRTDQGKAVSSQNSLRHGLRSQSVVIPGEDPAEYEALRDSMLAHFGPKTPSESAQVDILIACTWRLLRIPRLEAAIFAQCDDPAEAFILHSRTFANLVRYQNSTQRAYDHAKKELEILQEARLLTEQTRAIGFARQETDEAPVQDHPVAPDLASARSKGLQGTLAVTPGLAGYPAEIVV